MIPEQRLSTSPILSSYFYPYNQHVWDNGDWDWGGIAALDNSQGLQVQAWRSEYTNNSIRIIASTTEEVITTVTRSGIINHSFAFDQNMRWQLVYTLASGAVEHVWYDSAVADYVTTIYDNGEYSPRLVLDDSRAPQIPASDDLLFYMRDGALYFRAQRDRFTIEYFLVQGDNPKAALRNVGMNNKWRLQFQFTRIFNPALDPPPLSVTIVTTSFPEGNLDVPYSYPLTARWGTPPYTWEVDLGILPPGLYIEAGTIQGTPAMLGTFRFTLRVTDATGEYDTFTYRITINPED